MTSTKYYKAPTPDNLDWPTQARIERCTLDGDAVVIDWSDQQQSRFHPLWLRDNCACETCLHSVTREHLIDLVDIPLDIKAAGVELNQEGSLRVIWNNDKHASIYNPGWLFTHSGLLESHQNKPSLWSTAELTEPPSFQALDLTVSDQQLHNILLAVEKLGLARVRGLGSSPDTVEAFGLRIGPVRETHFARIFDVISVADGDSNAYTSEELSAHTDIPTRESPPGLQLLHCLVSQAQGGESTMSDGYKIAADIAELYPEEYKILTSVKWCFANRGGDTDYRWEAPIISLDDHGDVSEVRLLPFSRAPLMTDYDNIQPSYRALKLFMQLANSDKYKMRYKLLAGDLIIFDNRRILHGRAEFFPQTGDRQLRGLYLDRDDMHSKIRMTINQQNRQI